MKKKLLFGAFAALALGAGITTAVHITQTTDRASAMMLENAEALAESEVFGNVVCYTDGAGNLCAKVYDSNGRNPKKFYYYN